MKLRSKRHVLILEVLIAFTLIMLSFFPLISPHVMMMQEHQKFSSKLELNHLVNLFYVDLLEQLYLNKIDWYILDGGQELTLSNPDLAKQLKGLPYKSSIKMTNLKPNKSNPEGNRTLYLMTLTLEFQPKWPDSEPIKYNFNIVVDHNVKGAARLPIEEEDREKKIEELQKRLRGL